MFTDVAAAVALLLLLSVAKVTWLSFSIGEGMAKDGTGRDRTYSTLAMYSASHVLSRDTRRHRNLCECISHVAKALAPLLMDDVAVDV